MAIYQFKPSATKPDRKRGEHFTYTSIIVSSTGDSPNSSMMVPCVTYLLYLSNEMSSACVVFSELTRQGN